MKPNDKAYAAAIAEGKRWDGSYFTGWKVLREDDIQNGWDIVAEFDNREERDEALERLRAEAMVNAAFAAQFPPSEDYAGLIARARKIDQCDDHDLYVNAIIITDLADALEAVLAERDAMKAVVEIYEKKLNGIEDEIRLAAQSAIAAVRPHIEAAERERCAKIVEGACTATNNPLIVKILHGNYQSLVDRDFKIAAAIWSGK